MIGLKKITVSTLLVLSCMFGNKAVHAAEPAFDKLDCRHLFAEDVLLSDELETLSKQEQKHIAQDTAPAESQFFVRLDPIPGFGIMKGVTLSPAGRPIKQDSTEHNLDHVRQELAVVRHYEQDKVCLKEGGFVRDRDRLSDEAPRATP
ncbi:hypothetical protein ACI01nite_15800 [Acetobacter cibinongensis]|uniref:Uncharacterized protein n=1 Tax=Acetobacter cibinongensis TaxID=146475 RepID=A0A0D6MZJ9_9PROT|nr:hypothetical protein [Acetobacter cibinongensis]GAN59114.1 hypothetical protein Abci_001_130 [Acetobacter cibinongensis]GBQ19532.1 hypothetical protein AA0482_2589 [Acetobacter cibinongensis NRIC 0482]GEL58978.1 hypothetical protein ACI01nite_15800 [Acetobacter cibinongensis]